MKNLDNEKFNKIENKITENLLNMDINGKTLPQFEHEAKVLHNRVITDFLVYLNSKGLSQKNIIFYKELITEFLEDIVFYYSKDLRSVLEINIVDFLFDIFPRKVEMKLFKKKLMLKAIAKFMKFCYKQGYVIKNIVKFVNELYTHNEYFKSRVKNTKVAPFWEISQNWRDELFSFKEEHLNMPFYLYPNEIVPQSYIGSLENFLVNHLNEQICLAWREFKNTHSKKELNFYAINLHLTEFMFKWYMTSRKEFMNFTPYDLIIIERETRKKF